MVWREFVATKIPEHACVPGVLWADISIAEERLGYWLPEDLKALLFETNGVFGEYEIPLIWPLERILDENLSIKSDDDLKTMYMPLDCLFFFADAGNGDLFGHAIVNGEVRGKDVFAWNHEDDSRTVVATSLERFMKGWTDGTIKV